MRGCIGQLKIFEPGPFKILRTTGLGHRRIPRHSGCTWNWGCLNLSRFRPGCSTDPRETRPIHSRCGDSGDCGRVPACRLSGVRPGVGLIVRGETRIFLAIAGERLCATDGLPVDFGRRGVYALLYPHSAPSEINVYHSSFKALFSCYDAAACF